MHALSHVHTHKYMYLCVCILGPLKVFCLRLGRDPWSVEFECSGAFTFPTPSMFQCFIFFIVAWGRVCSRISGGLSHSGDGKRFWYWPSWRSHRVTSFLLQSGQSDLEKRRWAPVAFPAARKQTEAAGLPPQSLGVSGPLQEVRSSFWILSPWADLNS